MQQRIRQQIEDAQQNLKGFTLVRDDPDRFWLLLVQLADRPSVLKTVAMFAGETRPLTGRELRLIDLACQPALAANVSTFHRARNAGAKAFQAELLRIANSQDNLWRIAEGAGLIHPLTQEERAMVGQAINPRLAGKTPNSVYKRYVAIAPPKTRRPLSC